MKNLTHLTEKNFINLPQSLLSEKIVLINLCNLTNDEISLFKESLGYLERYLDDNNIKIPGDILPLNLCFVEDNEKVVFPYSRNSFGRVAYHAVYNMGKMRSEVKNNHSRMMIFLEELVHHFLFCRDEIRVKHLVYGCLKYKYPDAPIGYFYTKEALGEN